jgi:PIN domain nuclease of toxin-antitoxin system
LIHLLDTHVFNWFRIAPEKLGKTSLKLLQSADTQVAISAVSSLEVAQLAFKGRLVLPTDVMSWMDGCFSLFGCRETQVDTRIAAEAYRLPGEFHADPADRLLIATARVNDWSLLTADRRIIEYPHVRSMDAGR